MLLVRGLQLTLSRSLSPGEVIGGLGEEVRRRRAHSIASCMNSFPIHNHPTFKFAILQEPSHNFY